MSASATEGGHNKRKLTFSPSKVRSKFTTFLQLTNTKELFKQAFNT